MLLVLVHEAGHAIAAWSTGLNVRAIVVAGFGGLCFTESQPSSRPRALALYSGGLIAQILLFAGTLVLVSAFGNPPNVFLSSLALMFTLINAIMFIGNAVPTRVGSGLVTDGYLIWRVLRGDRLDGA
ncbi:MAG TPA: M50 family metallopeptidase [Dokdonella sp.]|nr:M50 family metallopeptidase [Dokdonella sp.]